MTKDFKTDKFRPENRRVFTANTPSDRLASASARLLIKSATILTRVLNRQRTLAVKVNCQRVISILYYLWPPIAVRFFTDISKPIKMTTMTRRPSCELSLTRELSIEETYTLASLARRKSSTNSRTDLRHKLGTAQLLEALEYAIRNSPPPSPQQRYLTPSKSQHTSWTLDSPKQTRPAVDEYGFAYDDEENEDDGLSLARTQSHSL